MARYLTVARVLAGCTLLTAVLLHAQCSIERVVVNGRIENAPDQGLVRVQLVYANQRLGESAEATLDGERFRLEISFLTQSHAAVVNGIGLKCKRKPESVLVTLTGDDREHDRVSLTFPKDFQKTDASGYAVRSPIVLRGDTGAAQVQ